MPSEGHDHILLNLKFLLHQYQVKQKTKTIISSFKLKLLTIKLNINNFITKKKLLNIKKT